MACPVCTHTMQAVSLRPQVFWCSRCGTLRTRGIEQIDSAPFWIARDQNALAIIKGEWPPADRLTVDPREQPISGSLNDVVSESLDSKEK